MKVFFDRFIIGMVVVTALAFWKPAWGASHGPLHMELATKAGVPLIFFLYGALLPLEALKVGAMRWRLHVVVQLGTFLFIPLLVVLLDFAAGRWLAQDLRLGFFFLGVLPSTVSSSVAMTSAARGDVAGAIFNATLSSLLGVVLTPLWINILGAGQGTTGPLGPVMRDITCWVILPMVIGQLSRPVIGAWITRHKKRVQGVDRLVILLIIYSSFCDSVNSGQWAGHGTMSLTAGFAGSALLLALAMAATALAADAVQLDFGGRITAMFCGSQKSLALGAGMAKMIFGAHPGLGLILLPIMIYHPMQLIACGVLVQRWAARPAASTP